MRDLLAHDDPAALAVGDVECPAARLAPRAVDLFDDLAHAVLDHVRHRDARALVGEQVSGRAAHAAGCSRDQRDASGDRAVERRQARHG